MDKKLRNLFSIALAMTIAVSLGACGAKKQDEAANTQTEAETSTTKVASEDAETSVYEGTLLTAYDQHVVIAGEEGDVEFVTNDNTLYKAGEEGQMYLDDIVSVTYHVNDDVKYADEIDLIEHMDDPLEYAGVLVDSGDDYITLVNKGLSVTFQIDEESYIVGDLTRGDEIELTYLGDLSEYPYANVVAVVKEVELPTTSTVHGVVSEISGNTVLVGIDSAHAYRFGITDKTTISGAATKLSVGDQIDVTFEGKIGDQPNAISIKVVKTNQNRAYTINGTISSADDSSVTLDTGKAKYVFSIGKTTKLTGEKPAKGYKAEITYTGDLNNKPQASIIYCVKDAKETSKADAKKEQAKQANAKKAESPKKTDDKKAEESKKQDAKKTDDKKAEEAKAQADAEALAKAEAEAKAKAEIEAEEKAKAEAEAEAKAKAEAEAQAEAEAKAKAEAEAEAQAKEQAEDTEPETSAPEPEPEPDVVEPEPEPENVEPTEDENATQTEAETTTDPEATGDSENATEEQAAQTNPDLGISGQGTIVAGDEKEKTIEIELKDGKKITLKYDDDTKIAAGYIPMKGDVVKVEYGNTSMLLKDIQLVSRPEAAEDATQADAEQGTEQTAEETSQD